MSNPLSFVHVSDIHFGQDVGGALVIHEDVRERLVDDVEQFFRKRRATGGSGATGILVTGDIAHGGKKDEYDQASIFLDRVAVAGGSKGTEVRSAPGNHDVDLREITHGVASILKTIREKGEDEFDLQLEDQRDRSRFYDRFKEYAVFAEGYGCPLDGEGGNAGEKDYVLAPGRVIRIVAWNSALLCSGHDEKGKLLLGARQRALPINNGVEHVVLCHHPLPWFIDEADARTFLRRRARVFLSGHEHLAEITVEEVDENQHFLHLAAGAATPPSGYEYTYNILDFEWLADSDGLAITVHPRVWVDQKKAFDADYNRLGGKTSKRCVLGCPQFRATPVPTVPPNIVEGRSAGMPLDPPPGIPPEEVTVSDDDQFARIRLRFFRELSRVQRLTVLVALGALPRDLDGYPTMAAERMALDRLKRSGRLPELEAAIENEPHRHQHEGEGRPKS